MKSIARNTAEFVILAADTEPVEILLQVLSLSLTHVYIYICNSTLGSLSLSLSLSLSQCLCGVCARGVCCVLFGE
jgi:hypothetical protein